MRRLLVLVAAVCSFGWALTESQDARGWQVVGLVSGAGMVLVAATAAWRYPRQMRVVGAQAAGYFLVALICDQINKATGSTDRPSHQFVLVVVWPMLTWLVVVALGAGWRRTARRSQPSTPP
jgi:peptidoglycan/LPS O-acetylase OafA/YrhL